jgi:hypothetical protein
MMGELHGCIRLGWSRIDRRDAVARYGTPPQPAHRQTIQQPAPKAVMDTIFADAARPGAVRNLQFKDTKALQTQQRGEEAMQAIEYRYLVKRLAT